MIKDKQQAIIETAMTMFNETGFHSTPTSKIAKKAKVSVGTLFNYFSTKEDLIEAIYIYIKLHSKRRFLQLVQEKETDEDTLYCMWDAMITWGIENPEEFNYLELFSHSPFKHTYIRDDSLAATRQFREELQKVIPDTIFDGYPDYVLTLIDHTLHAAIRYILEHDLDNPEHFIQRSFDMLWQGLQGNHQQKDLQS